MQYSYKTSSPGARLRFIFSEAPKGLRVVSCMKFTQESENLFLTITLVDRRHEILLQSEVPPKQKGSISVTESVHGYQALSATIPIQMH